MVRATAVIGLVLASWVGMAPRAAAQGVALPPPRLADAAIADAAIADAAIADAAIADAAIADPAVQLDEDGERLRHLLGVRTTLSDWMRGLGGAALISMAATNVLGAISFHDRYGWSARYEDTPCAQGNAVWNEYCEGTVWPHAIAGGLTTTLYVTASMLGIFMPDPLRFADQRGARGERIRLHRALRVVTSALIISQALLGIFLSNADDWFGLTRQQDFELMQALATTHVVLGAAGLVSLTAQGAVMVF